MCDNEFEKKKTKFKPRIKFNHNIYTKINVECKTRKTVILFSYFLY